MRTETSIYRENSHNNESSPCRISGSSLTSSCHTIHPKSHPTSIIRCRYFRIQPFAVLDDFLPDKWSNEEKKIIPRKLPRIYRSTLRNEETYILCQAENTIFGRDAWDPWQSLARLFPFKSFRGNFVAFGGNPWTTYGTVTGCFIRIPAKRWLHCEWKKPA